MTVAYTKGGLFTEARPDESVVDFISRLVAGDGQDIHVEDSEGVLMTVVRPGGAHAVRTASAFRGVASLHSQDVFDHQRADEALEGFILRVLGGTESRPITFGKGIPGVHLQTWLVAY